MKKLIDIWYWLDGKKRNIAHGYWFFVGFVLPIWIDNNEMPVVMSKIIATLGAILTGVGYGHAEFKKRNLK